jgi:hypothetical protein
LAPGHPDAATCYFRRRFIGVGHLDISGICSGAGNFLPYMMTLKADAQFAAKQPCQSSLDLLSQATSVAETNGERWYEAETYRLKSECLLSLPAPDIPSAEGAFVHALEFARAQGAKMWELRAASSLARLWRDQGKHAASRELLAPVYGWFHRGLRHAGFAGSSKDTRRAGAVISPFEYFNDSPQIYASPSERSSRGGG